MTNRNRSPIILYFSTNDKKISKIIRWAGLSWTSHVSVSDGDVVLEITLDEKSWFVPDFPYSQLESHRRQEQYKVAHSKNPNLQRFENKEPPNKMRSVLRFLTFGLYKYKGDCVGVAIQVLQEAGVPVPSRISTPGGLRRWVKRWEGRYRARK